MQFDTAINNRPQHRVIAAGLRQRTATRHVGQEHRQVALEVAELTSQGGLSGAPFCKCHYFTTAASLVADSPTNYLQDIIDHLQDANHRYLNLLVQSHPRLHTDKNITIF